MDEHRLLEDKRRELLEQKALVELLRQRSLERQSDVPQMIISARQRRILLEHRHYLLTTLIEQFNRVALEGNSDPSSFKEFLDKIPSTLIKMRLVQNLTQSELARRTGISRFRLNRLERTFFAGATLTELKRISEALNKTSAQGEGGQ